MISGQQQCSPASQWLSSSSASSPSSFSSCAGKPLLTLFKISAWFEKNTYTTRKRHFSLQSYKSQLPRRSSDVFKICGAMQLLSGLCLAIGEIRVQYILNLNTIILKTTKKTFTFTQLFKTIKNTFTFSKISLFQGSSRFPPAGTTTRFALFAEKRWES